VGGFEGRLSEDGSRVYVHSWKLDQDWSVRDASTGVLLSEPVPENAIARGDDETAKVLAVSRDAGVEVVMASDGTALQGMYDEGPRMGLPVVASGATFGPDGTRLVTWDRNDLWMWETSSGRVTEVLQDAENSELLCAAFSTDGDHVITAASDGTVKRWDVTQFRSFDDVLKLARRVIPRELSVDEKKAHAISIE
jgi:WD40 repeat protein